MFEIILIFYGLSRMLQFSQFVRTLPSSVWDFFNNFLLIDATDRSKISSDQKRFFIALSLYPFSFFANTVCRKSQKISTASDQYFLSYVIYRNREHLAKEKNLNVKKNGLRLKRSNWCSYKTNRLFIFKNHLFHVKFIYVK